MAIPRCKDLDDNLKKNCQKLIAGVEGIVRLYNREDVDVPATLASITGKNKMILTDFILKDGAHGWYWISPNNTVQPDSTPAKIGKVGYQSLHQVRGTVFDPSDASKNNIENMKENYYVAIVVTKDGTIEVYGLHQGLSIKEAPYTPYNPETKRTRNVLLGSDDDAQEPCEPYSLLKTNYNTTITYLDSLLYVSAAITPLTLPDGEVASPYSQTLEQEGLEGVPVWSVSSGTLPAGLTLDDETGVISGSPTTANTYLFTIKVTDGVNEATQTYSVTIAA